MQFMTSTSSADQQIKLAAAFTSPSDAPWAQVERIAQPIDCANIHHVSKEALRAVNSIPAINVQETLAPQIRPEFRNSLAEYIIPQKPLNFAVALAASAGGEGACHCHKAENVAKKILKGLIIASATVLLASLAATIFLPASLTLTVATIAGVALAVFGSIALLEKIRQKKRFPGPLQKLADNIHAGFIRTLCTLASAFKEKNKHLGQIFTRDCHPYQFHGKN